MTQSVSYLINQIIKQICLLNFLVRIFSFKSELLAFCRSYRVIIFYLYILLGLLIPSIVFIKRSLEEISGDSEESELMGESGDSSEEEEISEAEAETRRTAKGKGKEVLPSTESQESHESSSSYVEDSSEVDKGQLLEDSDDLWEAKSKIRNLAENGVIDRLRKGQDITPQEFQDYLDVQEEYGDRLESYTNEGLDNQSALENLESELDDDLKDISDKLGSFDWDREVPKRTKLDSEKEYSSESSTVSTPKAVPASLTDSSPTPTPTSRPASDSTPSTAVPDSSTIPTPTNNPNETPSEYVQSISEGEMPSYTDPEDT
jgi:hypothetical protein